MIFFRERLYLVMQKITPRPLQVVSSIYGRSVVSVLGGIDCAMLSHQLQVSDFSKDNDWAPFTQHSCILIMTTINALKSSTALKLLPPCSILTVSTGMLAISHSAGNMHSAHVCYKSALSLSWQPAEDWLDEQLRFKVWAEAGVSPAWVNTPVSVFTFTPLITP